jgi:hypothetical protein
MAVVDGDDPVSPQRVIRACAAAFSAVSTNKAVLRGGAGVVVLNPEHATALEAAGFERAEVAAAIAERAGNCRADLARQVPAFGGAGDPDGFVPCFGRPEDVVMLVAGGGGLYSTVMPTWCAGTHRSTAVSVEVDLDQACELPGA